MSEYWSKDDVIENAILDLQHECDDLRDELARRDEIIRRLKEDAEILCDIADNFGDDAVAVLKHRALIEELNQTGELK